MLLVFCPVPADFVYSVPCPMLPTLHNIFLPAYPKMARAIQKKKEKKKSKIIISQQQHNNTCKTLHEESKSFDIHIQKMGCIGVVQKLP
jgi:hypothetical protein